MLAKSAAPEDVGRVQAKRLIEVAQEALVHSAVVLGAVTYGANNSPEIVQVPGGATQTRLRRDSTSLPQHAAASGARRRPARSLKRKEPPPVCSASWVLSATQNVVREPSQRELRAAAKRRCTALRKGAEAAALDQAVASAAVRLAPPASQLTAAARLEALRERVLLRSQTARTVQSASC